MSFFVQSERNTNFQILRTPSPGQYQPTSLGSSRKYACAPFGSTQPLNRLGKIDKKKQGDADILNKQYDEVFLVNDMNIKIKQQQQTSSVFKSGTQRFNNTAISKQPGPGQYQLKNTIVPKAKSKSQAQFLHQFLLPTKMTVPSIPADNLGFKQDEKNQMKKVQPPKPDAPHPGSYQISTSLNNGKGVVPWKEGKTYKKDVQTLPGPGDYNYKGKITKSVSSCFHSSTDRFGQIRKFKQQKIPGPGQYNLEGSKKASHNMSSESYFNSKTTRFQKQSNDQTIGPGMYFNQLNPKNKSQSVNTIKRMPLKQETNVSKHFQRKSLFQTQNTNPGPGQYRTNFGISYQLHKALLKKQTPDVLPKQKRVVPVFEPKEEDYFEPGPGSYEQQIKHKNSKGRLWKKVQVVNLKEQQEPSPSPMDYPNFYNTIQSKVKQMNSKLTLTDQKPFNSGTQRFKHYSNQKRPQFTRTQDTQQQQQAVDLIKKTDAKKVKRLVMTTIKVRVPFGISSNKYEQKDLVYEGPDYYDKNIDWVKPSFNIRGKLQ